MRLTLLVTIFICISSVGCQTTKKVYQTVPLSTPPEIYDIPPIDTEKDLIKAYQVSTIRIAQWQKWFNIQVGSNYFNYADRASKDSISAEEKE